jgi:16S rRNA processing protein RimM
MSDKYRIGAIARSIGIKGEVIVHPETYSIERFFDLSEVWVGASEQTAVVYPVEIVRMHKNRPVIKFANVDTRDDADRLRERILYVDETERIQLPPGSYFVHEIIGMRVFTADETYVGVVREVLALPGHNVYVVRDAGKEYLIPAVDEFIDSIDADTRMIRINPIDGLLD